MKKQTKQKSKLCFDVDKFTKIALTPGVSGDEDQIRKLVIEELKKCKNIDEVKIDGMGNVIGHIYSPKRQDLPENRHRDTIIVSAHMDTSGLRITKIHDGRTIGTITGALEFQCVGLSREQLTNNKVRVHSTKGDVIGIVCTEGPHICDGTSDYLPKMIIDTGLQTLKDVKDAGIEIGQAVTFYGGIDSANGIITGPFLDNRMGVMNILELAQVIDKSKLDVNVVLACTVHEESDLSGIKCLVNNLKPAAIIVMDTTVANQHYTEEDKGYAIMSKGPAIETGTYANKKLLELIEGIAKKQKLEYQKEVTVDIYTTGCTEAYPARWYGYGTPAITVSYATRYLHSNVEMLDVQDALATVELVKDSLYNIKTGMEYF